MGTLTDKRTLVGIGAGRMTTYAHGLPAAPDAVHIRIIQSSATISIIPILFIPVDNNNVTISNIGSGSTPNLEVCAVRFHSIVL